MEIHDSIAARILRGELPSAVLRSVHQSNPGLERTDLGLHLERAFPGPSLIACVWQWRMNQNSPVQDALFDYHLIRLLLREGVDVPWTREYWESEWQRIQPALAAEAEEQHRAAMKAVSIEALLEKVQRIGEQPVCVQALWDGDSTGWFIRLEVVTRSGAELTERGIGIVRYGGDGRLFTGAVPPWPEAQYAADVGARLAKAVGAEFYFPAPDEPDDSRPTWLRTRT